MDGNGHAQALAWLRRASFLDGPDSDSRSRAELEQRSDTSRTTVYRATNELASQGLLEEANGGYRTTAKGQAVSHAIDRYLTSIETIERLEPLIERIAHPALLERIHLLADAEVTVADEENKYRANDRAVELFGQSETIRSAMTGPGDRLCLDESTTQTRETDMAVEMCFTPEALPTSDHLAAESAIPEVFEHFEVYVTEEIPFTFVLHDDIVTIVARNNVGTPVVVAETDDPRAYRWLENRYENAKASARPLENAPL